MVNIQQHLVSESIVSILKVYLFFLTSKYIGYFFAFALFCLVYVSYRKILEKAFGLRMLRAADKVFVGDRPHEQMTMVGTLVFKDFSIDKCKKRLLHSFKENGKLSSRLIYKFRNYFWEEVYPTEERFNEMVKVVEKGVKNYDEAMEFARKQTEVKLDLTKQGMIIYLIPFTERTNEGAVVFVNDHCYSDGMGMVSLLFTMSDNFTEDFFPKSMKVRERPGIIRSFIDLLIFLFTGWINAIKVMRLKAQSNICTKKASGLSSIAKTLVLDIHKFKEVSHKLKLTINELILNLLSAGLKRMDSKATNYTVAIPIGNTKAPKSLKKTPVRNLITGITFRLALIDDIERESDIVLSELKQFMSNRIVTIFLVYLGVFLNELFPFIIFKTIAMELSTKVDITVSNMPGPTKPLFYDGMELISMVPFTSVGPNKAFCSIFSYCNSIFITTEFDKTQGPDPEELNKHMMEIYNSLSKGK